MMKKLLFCLTALLCWAMGSLALAALLVFLVLVFCTPTGFFGSLIVGVVISVAGWFVLREHPDADAH